MRAVSRLVVLAVAGLLAFGGLAACQDSQACAAESRIVARPPSGGGARSGNRPRSNPQQHGPGIDVEFGDDGDECDE